MKRVWQPAASLLAGLLITALYAMPQAYTISARPGALNYIEGNVYLNGHAVREKGLKSTFLNANDTLFVAAGKAEVLLTPGVFLRLGDNSAVTMVSPSLTDTQVEIKRGEAMIEAAGLMKDNDIQILDQKATIHLQKDGLYRFRAGAQPSAAVLEGKAEVELEGRKIELGKDRETALATPLKSEKFNAKEPDELYAWSNMRAEYDAAASYQSAKNVSMDNSGGGWWGYGFGGGYNPGWYWNNGFSSWAWLPAYGACYSPFGWGFYAPGIIGYAPVVIAPVYGSPAYWKNYPKPGAPVAVNPKNPPAIAALKTASPAEYASARTTAVHSYASTGFYSSNGTHIAAGRAAFAGGGGAVAHASGGGAGGHAGGFSGGGFSGGGHSGGASSGGGSGGGGHR